MISLEIAWLGSNGALSLFLCCCLLRDLPTFLTIRDLSHPFHPAERLWKLCSGMPPRSQIVCVLTHGRTSASFLESKEPEAQWRSSWILCIELVKPSKVGFPAVLWASGNTSAHPFVTSTQSNLAPCPLPIPDGSRCPLGKGGWATPPFRPLLCSEWVQAGHYLSYHGELSD